MYMTKYHKKITITSLALCIISIGIIVASKRFINPVFAHYRYPSFFDNYNTWKSGRIKSNDTMGQVLRAMNTTKTTFNESTETGEQFVDINGDGLLDFLYFSKTPSDTQPGIVNKTALFINKGNFTFEPVYKCFIIPDGS